MILTITTTHHPATDLGYLLHKHPDKLQTIDLSVGKAHVFYPESTEAKTTACLLLDIDPIDMVRGARNLAGSDFALGQYVSDRMYVASSFMSVAIAKTFSSALNGKCKDKPELVDVPMPFEISIAVIAAPMGGDELIKKLFEPLGYQVQLIRHPLDEKFPEWGDGKYYTVQLTTTLTLKQILSHLYVLLPVLDNEKHYFINHEEVDKLLQKGEGWLKTHPEKGQISRRYFMNLNSLSRIALERLTADDEKTEDETDEVTDQSERIRRRETLHDKRLQMAAAKLLASGAERVLDLGCGEGKLIRLLLKEKQFTRIAGMDVSYRELLKAKERLHYNEMAPMQKERVTLFQGSLTYRDSRLQGYDAAAVVEVIEHLDAGRLKAFERVLFEFAKPETVVLTTPNKEFNSLFEKMNPEEFRHADHRFEWTRQEFKDWVASIENRYGYQATITGVGDEDEKAGAPSQMAVFTLA